MSSPVDLLRQLLQTGKVALRARPRPVTEQHPAAVALLSETYATFKLDVAGPRLDFEVETAVRAADVTLAACWFLVQHGEPAEELERFLTLPPPRSPADHLSADLLLRVLPQVHRRARALTPSDPLCDALARLLRQWPLSGVLSEVADGPATPVEFAGHPGLLLHYAERWARNPKPEWLPQGRALEFVAMVLREQGRELPPHARLAVGDDTEKR